MSKNLTIIDKDYKEWVKHLGRRYRQAQVRASVKVNHEVLRFYWELGQDIINKQAENHYGSRFYARLSADLKEEIPEVEGLSETSIRYAKRMYELYLPLLANLPQLGEKSQTPTQSGTEEATSQNLPQLGENFIASICAVPWGHHKLLIDKCSNDPMRAFFYVRKCVEEGWSRSILLNLVNTGLYEREGKALTNFSRTFPEEASDLAQEMTKDPYNFAFTGIRGRYNERKLKDALLSNITDFLIELGTGFAYMGKEYRLQIGERENFIDLLFYNTQLSCYVVVEVKIGRFEFQDAGQLGGYVVACNHQLRKEGRDNPTIGLLICKEKDRIQAQYALEASSQPLGISEYDLEKFYPAKVEGTIPTIEEIENKLSKKE